MYSKYAIETRIPRTRSHFLIELASVEEFTYTRGTGSINGTLADGTEVYLSLNCWSSHLISIDADGNEITPKNTQRDNIMRAIEAHFKQTSVQVWVTQNGYLSDVYA